MTQQPPPYAPAPVAAPEKRANGVGLAALIVGAVALLFAVVPVLSFIAWLPSLAAIVLGIVGLVLKNRKRLFAWIGLGLGVVAWAIAIAVSIASLAGIAGAVQDAVESSSPQSVATPGAEQTAEAEPAEPAADSVYAVTIDGGTQTTDYEGAPALVVSYTFTNNSNEDASFLTALTAKAFQNGVELETAIVTDADFSSTLNDVKPGATTTVQVPYLLTDTSPVTVEVSELFDLNDALIATSTITLQ